MTCTGTSCRQGRDPCRDGCNKRTCAELGGCQNRTPPCDDTCLPILNYTSPERDWMALALDLALAAGLVGTVIFAVFAAIGFWSAR